MSKFIVISHTHSIVPFAHRLQREGHDVTPIIVIKQFESSWHGKLKPSPRNDKGLLDDGFLKDTLSDPDSIILTDSLKIQPRLVEEFGVAPERIYGRHVFDEGEPTTPLRVGGWFDGEELRHIFGAVVDRGAWHGGSGPEVDGAVTLIRVDSEGTMEILGAILADKVSELKSQGFRGLVQFGIDFQTKSGNPEVSGVGAGWPFLVTHGFLSELESLGSLLSGHKSDPQSDSVLSKKFVTVLPVSRPPWPTAKARFRFETMPIEGLTPKQMSRVFWHDVQVDQSAGQLRTAGLDGLVGVVRGAADTSQLSLALALETATKLEMPEKQFRDDAGQQVQLVLAHLEQKYGLLL